MWLSRQSCFQLNADPRCLSRPTVSIPPRIRPSCELLNKTQTVKTGIYQAMLRVDVSHMCMSSLPR